MSSEQRKSPRRSGPEVRGASPEARKLAAAILEVLGGTLTPADAAAAMGVSPPRYYLLESRALRAARNMKAEPQKPPAVPGASCPAPDNPAVNQKT